MSRSPDASTHSESPSSRSEARPGSSKAPGHPKVVVLTGNPNCGKTTLFNALTGLRAKVGNYAGVTVERKEGKLRDLPPEVPARALDLPGSYSLSPQSLDERVARDVLLNRLPGEVVPDLVVVVVDASNLERNLYYATQVIELGYPTLIALNMVDVAEENGHLIDHEGLSGELGVPVIPTVASHGQGLSELRQAMVQSLQRPPQETDPASFYQLPPSMEREIDTLADTLRSTFPGHPASYRAESLLVLADEKVLNNNGGQYPQTLHRAVWEARQRLENEGIEWRSEVIESRYRVISAIHDTVTTEQPRAEDTFSDRIDQVVTHRFWGPLIFVGIMAFMFQSIFSVAPWPMDALESGISWLGGRLSDVLPPGDLRSLLVDGIIAGVGAVVVFLPQILMLFLFIGLLEDTGYMARAAFLMDRLMGKVGLHGKSFIPLLSSFACAIPGIMATRTIETRKDRLVTLLVAPLMSCSARLPVYTLLIAACVPNDRVLGFIRLQGITLLGLYLLGVAVALGMAWLFKKTLLKGDPPLLIMELPPYKRPVLKIVLRHMWERSRIFLSRAGTVILASSIILWFLASYPRPASLTERYDTLRTQLEERYEATLAEATPTPDVVATYDAERERLYREEAGERLRTSFAGRLGQGLEPIIKPLGMDWKIGIGVIASLAAREVFVSTMSTVYNVGAEAEEDTGVLAQTLLAQTRADGTRLYTPLMGLSLMVFFVFALQCVSTVAVVRRETNSWRWPLFQWAYMGALAWLSAFVIYQGGRLLGFE